MAIVKPVTLVEAKEWMRIDHDLDDMLITSLIEAATGHTQDLTRRQWVDDTKTVYWDTFPAEFVLPWTPIDLAAVTTLKYYNTAGVQTTLPAAYYEEDADSVPSRVRLSYGYEWPALQDRTDAIELIWVAGYGTEAEVPEPPKIAIKMLVAHWYENREAATDGRPVLEVPMAAKALLAPYMILGADS